MGSRSSEKPHGEWGMMACGSGWGSGMGAGASSGSGGDSDAFALVFTPELGGLRRAGPRCADHGGRGVARERGEESRQAGAIVR